MKKSILILLGLISIPSSCVSVDSQNRRWLSLPLPPDPLRDLLLDGLNGQGSKPPLINFTGDHPSEIPEQKPLRLQKKI